LASVEKRTRSNGKIVRYRVRWLDGGRGGELDQETFDSQSDARRFKALVDANGNRRPSAAQLHEYDFEYLIPARPTSQVSPPVVQPAAQVPGDPAGGACGHRGAVCPRLRAAAGQAEQGDQA
jgi:hypothetical protein